ncbi:ankyrin repeat protein [Elusimicrobium posterum]|uniref:ankyrin repeat domain-containing protein n=1 Tax=Elusimicrobium posterum TaxID=3116653 RepID=UPI003C764FB1
MLDNLKNISKKHAIVALSVVLALPIIVMLVYTLKSDTPKSATDPENAQITVNLKSQSEIIDELAPLIRENDYDNYTKKIDKEVRDINAVNSKGNTLFIIATGYENVDAINYIYHKGGDVNKANTHNGDTPLLIAARKGNSYLVEILLQAGANVSAVNNYKQTALILAAEAGNKKIVELFISRGSIAGASADNLFYFVSRRNTVGVEAMLQSGINPNIKDKVGFTPLYTASAMGEASMVSWLLEYNANIDTKVNDGSTPLIAATKYKKPVIFKLLMNKKPDLNIQNAKGETALYWATANNMLNEVETLINAGADPYIATKQGVTPFKFATDRRYSSMLKLFKKYNISR